MNPAKTQCPKCNGTGKIEAYQHINNGWCYACGGTGLVNVNKKTGTQEPVKTQKTVKINNETCGVFPFGDMLRITGQTGMVLIDWELAKKGEINIIEVGDGWRREKESIKRQLQQQIKKK